MLTMSIGVSTGPSAVTDGVGVGSSMTISCVSCCSCFEGISLTRGGVRIEIKVYRRMILPPALGWEGTVILLGEPAGSIGMPNCGGGGAGIRCCVEIIMACVYFGGFETDELNFWGKGI